MEPSNYIIWNTLGIVAASKGKWTYDWLEGGLHYQSFCDHSKNFV
jgi:hypothetical protein